MDVWDVFTDPTSWPEWWPGVTAASYGDSPKPYGVGTFRQASVGGQIFEETIVTWDAGERFAYAIDRATVPLAHAQLECTELEDSERGTRVRWTLAAEPRLLLHLTAPLMQAVLNRLLRRAVRNLDRLVARKKAERGAAREAEPQAGSR